MARSFASGSSNYAEYAGAVVTALPLTLFGWFQVVSATTAQALLSISTAAGSSRYQLATAGASGIVNCNAINTGGTGAQSDGGAISNDTWFAIGGVFTSTTSRLVYLDGAAGTLATTSITVSGVDRTTIGARYNSGTRGAYLNGKAAECAVWNAALNALEMLALANGVCPYLIRPTSLVGYWPLWGLHSPEIDIHPLIADSTLRALTLSGTAQTGGPPVEPWSRRFWKANYCDEVTGSTYAIAVSLAQASALSLDAQQLAGLSLSITSNLLFGNELQALSQEATNLLATASQAELAVLLVSSALSLSFEASQQEVIENIKGIATALDVAIAQADLHGVFTSELATELGAIIAQDGFPGLAYAIGLELRAEAQSSNLPSLTAITAIALTNAMAMSDQSQGIVGMLQGLHAAITVSSSDAIVTNTALALQVQAVLRALLLIDGIDAVLVRLVLEEWTRANIIDESWIGTQPQ